MLISWIDHAIQAAKVFHKVHLDGNQPITYRFYNLQYTLDLFYEENFYLSLFCCENLILVSSVEILTIRW